MQEFPGSKPVPREAGQGCQAGCQTSECGERAASAVLGREAQRQRSGRRRHQPLPGEGQEASVRGGGGISRLRARGAHTGPSSL